MPVIDQFLSAMLKKGATDFVLKPGQRPHFMLADGTEQSFSRVLTGSEVIKLINEMLPAQDRLSEASVKELTFPYTPAGGSTFLFTTRRERDSFQVLCRPQVAQANASTAVTAPTELPRAGETGAAKTVDVAAPERLSMEFLFRTMRDLGASDLHLSSINPPMIRKDGDMAAMSRLPVLTDAAILDLLKEIVPARSMKQFLDTGDTDFAYEVKGVGRFRSNLFRDRKGPCAVFRLIPERIVTVEDLNIPPKVQNLCFMRKGLVLVTGPTGSGKSTTLSALIDLINRKREDHIVTIEDPIEFVHENKSCLINQREVGVHTESFKHALRAALREDPDVVLVGEMRDLETIAIAIETAVTGHLVFGTLHTSGAAATIDRVIDQFPPNQQSQIRVMLSESLKGVISQVLLKKRGGGRVAAFEVMIGTPSISNLVREGKTFQIPSVMQTSRGVGMVTMSDSLLELVKSATVEIAEAYRNAPDKDGFHVLLKRNNFELDPAGL